MNWGQPIPASAVKPKRSKWRRFGLPLLIIFGGLAMSIWPICAVLYRVEDVIFIGHCGSNLRQLGLALKMYANSHDHVYPADWQDLILHTEDLHPSVLICVGRHREDYDRSATVPQLAKEMDGPGGKYFSFIYLGRGLDDRTVSTDEVIAIERLGNHYGYAVSVLVGDGSVDLLQCKPGSADEAKYNHLLADHAAGVRPLRLRP